MLIPCQASSAKYTKGGEIVEIWKDINGYEGLYKVSDKGSVFSVKANKVMAPFDNKGYKRISLYKNNKPIKKLVHILVAEHFISEKPFNGAQVNHKDLDRKNNEVNNLEWCDGSTNVRHCIENYENRSENLNRAMSVIGKEFHMIGVEASKKPVKQIDIESGKIIAVYESARDAAKHTGASYKNISQVCNGQKKTHKGYKWAFADEEGVTTIRKE
jgi:hypothetical protein